MWCGVIQRGVPCIQYIRGMRVVQVKPFGPVPKSPYDRNLVDSGAEQMLHVEHKMSSPGIEPGLSRPQRYVLTTRRWGLSHLPFSPWRHYDAVTRGDRSVECRRGPRRFEQVELVCCRRLPYRVECTGSLLTSEVKQRRARSVLGWGTAWEDLRVLSAFSFPNLTSLETKSSTGPG